jgi:hypothetical protein
VPELLGEHLIGLLVLGLWETGRPIQSTYNHDTENIRAYLENLAGDGSCVIARTPEVKGGYIF